MSVDVQTLRRGDGIKWTSHGQSNWTTRMGRFIAFIPAGVDVQTAAGVSLPLAVRRSKRFQAKRISAVDRVLVEVPRRGQSPLTNFHCPSVDILRKVGEQVTVAEVELGFMGNWHAFPMRAKETK